MTLLRYPQWCACSLCPWESYLYVWFIIERKTNKQFQNTKDSFKSTIVFFKKKKKSLCLFLFNVFFNNHIIIHLFFSSRHAVTSKAVLRQSLRQRTVLLNNIFSKVNNLSWKFFYWISLFFLIVSSQLSGVPCIH